jgi:hypothetical protein
MKSSKLDIQSFIEEVATRVPFVYSVSDYFKHIARKFMAVFNKKKIKSQRRATLFNQGIQRVDQELEITNFISGIKATKLI